jgi:hypothetical protein
MAPDETLPEAPLPEPSSDPTDEHSSADTACNGSSTDACTDNSPELADDTDELVEDHSSNDGPVRSNKAESVPSSTGPSRTMALLRQATTALAELASADFHELSGDALTEAVQIEELAERCLASVRAHTLTAVEANGMWAAEGRQSLRTWLREQTAGSDASSTRALRTSRTLRNDLPASDRALTEGRIGMEHVRVLTKRAMRSPFLRERLRDEACGETYLISLAEGLDATQFDRVVQAWAIRSDPGGEDQKWRETDTHEQVTISKTLDGFHLSGWLDTDGGQHVKTLLDAMANSRRVAGDGLSMAQRRAGALVEASRMLLDQGVITPGSRVRPHLTITATVETIKSLIEATAPGTSHATRTVKKADSNKGTNDGLDSRWDSDSCTTNADGIAFGNNDAGSDSGSGSGSDSTNTGEDTATSNVQTPPLWDLPSDDEWTEGDEHVINPYLHYPKLIGADPATYSDGTPIPPAVLAQHMCDSEWMRVIFGPESTVLDVGREKRIFPANMTRGIWARDETCRYPGCDAPPGWGEIHHSMEWYKDRGPTSVDLGILLCHFHHRHVHKRAISISRRDGQWLFHDQHGAAITATHFQPEAIGHSSMPPADAGEDAA